MPKIDMKECTSKNIHSYGFDHETNTLAVCFRNATGAGNTYHYKGVTKQQFEALQKAESIGQWFHQNVRMNPTTHPGMKQGGEIDIAVVLVVAAIVFVILASFPISRWSCISSWEDSGMAVKSGASSL